ncbi:MAG: hypothetical protein M1358_14640 [Chloroflexi bacterium]|nr:hypothetical protein [Chloroflexota bacterium]
MAQKDSSAGTVSTLICVGISLALASAFFTAASLLDKAVVARFGGAGWVFVLAMIVTLPLITPLVKKWFRPLNVGSATPAAHDQ